MAPGGLSLILSHVGTYGLYSRVVQYLVTESSQGDLPYRTTVTSLILFI